MTRTYALKRLLEHGPLTIGEIVAITCWPYRTAWKALTRLRAQGIVTFRGPRGKTWYELTGDLEWLT